MSKRWNQNCCSWQFPFRFSQNQSNVTLGPGVPQLTTGRESQKRFSIRHHCPIYYGIRYIKNMRGLSQLGCFHGNFVITFLWCFLKKGGDKADKANIENYEWPHILVLRGYFPYPIIYYEYRILCHEYQSDLRLWIPNVHPSLYSTIYIRTVSA